MSSVSIGKVATATKLTVETIRYYEREGLLPEPSRSASGYRQYSDSSVKRLRFIKRAKGLGFTLSEIQSLLTISDRRGDKAEVKSLTENKLLLIQQRIADLKRIQLALSELSEQCDGDGCSDDCPILNALGADKDNQ